MGNLEKAGVGVVVALLLIIMVVAFTTDPESTEKQSRESAERAGDNTLLEQNRKIDSEDDNARINGESGSGPGTGKSGEGTGSKILQRRGDPDPQGRGAEADPVTDPSGGEGGQRPVRDPVDDGPKPIPAVTPDAPKGEWPKEVVFGKGDRLWTIAARTYGAGHADRMAREIQTANGIIDPRKIREGTKITLPAPVTSASGGEGSGATTPAPAAPQPRIAVPTLPWEPGPPTYVTPGDVEDGWYVVRQNESLSVIAQQQCGSVKFMSEIVKMNRIKNPDRVLAGTRLRLPKKP